MTPAHDEIWVDMAQFDTGVADGIWDGTASDPDAPGWYGEVRALIHQARGPAEPDELLAEPLVVESMRRVTIGAALTRLPRSAGARTFRRLVAMKVAAATTASVVGVATAAATTGIVATVVVPAIEEHVVPMIEQLAPTYLQPKPRDAGPTVGEQDETGSPAGAADVSSCARTGRCEPGTGEPAPVAPAPIVDPASPVPAPSAKPEPVEAAQPVVAADAPVETSAVADGAPGEPAQVDPATADALADPTGTAAPQSEPAPGPESSAVTPLADAPAPGPPTSTSPPAGDGSSRPAPSAATNPSPTRPTSTGPSAVPGATSEASATSRLGDAASNARDVGALATETTATAAS
jgi:hypothetical protein